MSTIRVHRILNLGAGTQSSVIYLMMCRGELPRAEVAIFADTQWEPKEVYTHLQWLEERGDIPIAKVTRGNLRDDALDFMTQRSSADGKRYASMPLFVFNPDNSRGMLNRQCTGEYKIEIIERYIRREVLGMEHGERVPVKKLHVNQVFGMSFDEMSRMRRPAHRWITNEYPLIDMKMRRQQVIEWAERYYPGHRFPRSACIGCPYRTNREWREMRDERPSEWHDAIDFDNAIRDRDRERQRERATEHSMPYLHRSCRPLDQAYLDDDQYEFAFGMENECEGMCGV
jgi:3'-phosphoadenosine 5'-phosphosulfate sulfotransferase (PAPS reductase)/FAD synthetase